MFDTLTPRPPDAIMQLMEMCKADPNPDKIDLGVGVYKDEAGHTTILSAVKKAEQLWWSEEQTKTYVGTVGNSDFRRLMSEMILGADNPVLTGARIASAQAAGGSGALRLGAELIATAHPQATVWISIPTWANHIPLIGSAGLNIETYPYYNGETLSVDFTHMCTHLRTHAKPGDVVLVHGCCHNPTGADFSPQEWDILADLMRDKGLVPFIDLAYFGLGHGMDADAYGLRKLIATVPEALIAASCSKNFALYRERVGLIIAVCANADIAKITQTLFGTLQRQIISMPPDHGAALVARVLSDPELRAEWSAELDMMRNRIKTLRTALSEALNVQGGEAMAAAIVNQNGMFSTLPISPAQAERLRAEHSIYVTNSGRMNIAGANMGHIPRLADAILSVL